MFDRLKTISPLVKFKPNYVAALENVCVKNDYPLPVYKVLSSGKKGHNSENHYSIQCSAINFVVIGKYFCYDPLSWYERKMISPQYTATNDQTPNNTQHGILSICGKKRNKKLKHRDPVMKTTSPLAKLLILILENVCVNN